MTWWKRLRWGWIVALLPLVAGCSAVRLAYNQGPELLYWWADGYVDFTREQSPRVRAALHDWFAWHRSTQLPEVARLLQRARAEVTLDATPAQACRWMGTGTELAQAAWGQAVPAMATLLPGLQPEQLRHLERRFDKGDEEFRREFLQATPQERQEVSLTRTVERAQSLYGRLDERQRQAVGMLLAASPFDPDRWFAERQARQGDILRELRALLAERAPPPRVEAALRGWADDLALSPRPAYRSLQLRTREFNCGLLAQIHNLTTPAQRRHAADKLKGWEEDVRALAAQRPPRPVNAEPAAQ